ncbi:MAG: glycosyltransferase, partial [Thermoleophilia bacterium]|nr:glycosyltransferase [Thermoleophilia bacterium]
MHVYVAYILSAVYFLAALLLAIYGLNCFVLTGLYLRTRGPQPQPGERIQEWPSVTVQLPLYNERWVARRLLDAVAALDYPRELLEIQVLDDSTDHTASIVRAVARRLQRAGLDVKVIHRAHREGYKAGALSNGLRQAKGELIAIFDADFVPQPDWLRQVVPHFQDQA